MRTSIRPRRWRLKMLALLAASAPVGLVLAGSFGPGTGISSDHDLGGAGADRHAVGQETSGPVNGSGIAATDLQIRSRMTGPVRAEHTPRDLVARWGPIVDRAADRFAVSARWIAAVIEIESGGRTLERGRPIRSVAGAMGLMQLMPDTWADMRLRHGLGNDPDAPVDNILAGTAYLAAMHARFGYPGLFAAYHAGPGRYAQFLRGRPLPTETRLYVARIAALLAGESAEGVDLGSRGSAMDEHRPSQSGKRPLSLFAIGGPQALVSSDGDWSRAVTETTPNRHVPMPSVPDAAEDIDPPKDGDFGPQPQPSARWQEPQQRDRLFALPPRR